MNKLDNLLKLYRLQLAEIMESHEQYTAFLKFAVPFYKLNFSDIVLLYAQRPSATMCADFHTWSVRLGLRIRAGAKGIPIIRGTENGNCIGYLFDVADIRPTPGHAIPALWSARGLSPVARQNLINNTQPLCDCVAEACRLAAERYESTDFLLEPVLQRFLVECASFLVSERSKLEFGDPLFVVFPALPSPVDAILVNQIIFSAAKQQLDDIYQIVKNERRNQHDTQREPAQNPRNNSGASTERAAEPAANRAVRATVDCLHAGAAPQTSHDDAAEQFVLQAGTAERRAGDGAQAGYHRGDEAAAPARKSRRTDTVGEQHPRNRGGNRESRGSVRSGRVALFAAAEGAQISFEALPQPPTTGNVHAEENEKTAPKDETPPVEVADAASSFLPLSPVHHYRIPENFAAPSGQKGKYQNNLAAIRLLFQLEEAGVPATPEEQATLAGYVGWGGIPQAFDPGNEKWAEEYAELHELLSYDEYNAARTSTLNAHYTTPVVIRAMYGALHRFGFEHGNILEPALGVGNYFGLLPETMLSSKLTGVELDSISGRIAKLLYPAADIRIQGFQDATFQSGSFDVAISNVPFGDYNISDETYCMHIHDFFFVKALDLVHNGGIVAFITSKGTLDKANPNVRRMIAQRADLLGAVRLPNDVFKANAGTSVTTDILFLQKRETPLTEEPDWLHLGYYNDTTDIKINQYYLEHPEMVLGTMSMESGMYNGRGVDSTCQPYPNKDLAEQLQAAVASLWGEYRSARAVPPVQGQNLPLDSTVKRFSYTSIGENIYYNDGQQLAYVEATGTKAKRIAAYCKLREAVREVIDIQLSMAGDTTALQEKQAVLHREYDAFVKAFGFINLRVNQLAMQEDIDIALLSSIEDKVGDDYHKGAVFFKATVNRKVVTTHADSPLDALLICLSQKGCIDLPYMSALCNLPPAELVSGLAGHIFADHENFSPLDPTYLTAEEYLSGDIRTKLAQAQALAGQYPALQANVAALRKVQPEWISATDIGVRLSSSWVDTDYINQFIYQLLKTPSRLQGSSSKSSIFASYDKDTAEWKIYNKRLHSSVLTTQGYGTQRINAYEILQHTLNQREITIKDCIWEDGKQQYVYNHKQTIVARQKQEKIGYDFREWLFADPTRRAALEQTYNNTFNRIRPRKYDGSYLELAGINSNITLRPHQKDAVARIRTGKNSLLAHVVGAGKSATRS